MHASDGAGMKTCSARASSGGGAAAAGGIGSLANWRTIPGVPILKDDGTLKVMHMASVDAYIS